MVAGFKNLPLAFEFGRLLYVRNGLVGSLILLSCSTGKQAGDQKVDNSFGFGLDLLTGLVLNRVLNVDGIKVRTTERCRLCPGGQHKFGRRDGYGRDAISFQLCGVVQTARRAGTSIGQGFYDRVTTAQFLKEGDGRRLREGWLHLADDLADGVALFEQAFQMIEKDAASRLADIEQADRFSRQPVESRRHRRRRSHSFIKRIHK